MELVGRNGIILNGEKFQFCQREIEFAGFNITDNDIKPHKKFIKAIEDFPTASKVTDVRSWFGLVHQVAHYNKLTEMMAPFKPLLSPKVQFTSSEDMDKAFQNSKKSKFYWAMEVELMC